MKTYFYERIVFFQGDEALPYIKMLNEKGPGSVLECLTDWHYPGEHETSLETSAGSRDRNISTDKGDGKGGYILSWNIGLSYIGLEFRTSKEAA